MDESSPAISERREGGGEREGEREREGGGEREGGREGGLYHSLLMLHEKTILTVDTYEIGNLVAFAPEKKGWMTTAKSSYFLLA